MTRAVVSNLSIVSTSIQMNNFFHQDYLSIQWFICLQLLKLWCLMYVLSLPLSLTTYDSWYPACSSQNWLFFVPLIYHVFSSLCDFANAFADEWDAHFYNADSSEPPKHRSDVPVYFNIALCTSPFLFNKNINYITFIPLYKLLES